MKIKIYCGLSLNIQQMKKKYPDIEFVGPVRRGDLAKDLQRKYHCIGIVDGSFYNNLAVSPSEILDLIRRGVFVCGSSSMGAMRAAELSCLGMKGIGRVYRHILETEEFCDDHLGQVYFDEEMPIEKAYIDLHFNIQTLLKLSKVTQREANAILKCYQETYFAERSMAKLEKDLQGKFTNKERLRVIFRLLSKCPSQKTLDAEDLVKYILDYRKELAEFNARERS